MADFLLELLSEEIPARMQAKASSDLARLFAEEIGKAGLTAGALQVYATPRRLALIARGLPLETAAVSEETKGPKVGAPPQALEGFLRKTGLTQEQLVERAGTWFAIIDRPGRRTADVLAEAIPAVVRAFPWPKSMRWGAASSDSGSLRWVRPLQGIVALLGDEVVPCEVAGIASGAATVGHRFHHPDIITIGNADDYAAKLRACQVIVDPEERQAMIRDRAAALAAAAGLTVIPDEGLVAENAGLTEWPVPLLGRFDPSFLAVPREVIQLTLRTNQKYFVLNDAGGRLAPAFICTANIDAVDGGAAIVAGNGKVLAARLSDAKFFWEQDLKVPLEAQAAKLSQIVFHEKLGTVADKVERVAKLARWLVEEGIVTNKPLPFRGGVGGGASRPTSSPAAMPHPNPSPEGEGLGKATLADMAEQAARLAKADLVTGMVGEFPELQGVMGGYYARAQGLPDAVADAIRDHYKPVGQGDEVPTAPVTVAVSLADKLDTLSVFFAINEKPSGSRDPYALRRQALGIIQLINRNELRVPLRETANRAISNLIAANIVFAPDTDEQVVFNGTSEALKASGLLISADGAVRRLYNVGGTYIEVPASDAFADAARSGTAVSIGLFDAIQGILDFFADRLKVQQREAGVRHDLIDAVFALGGEDDLVRLLARVKALQAFVATEDGANLLAGYKRAANILKKEGWADDALPAGPPAYAAEPEEAALAAALDAAVPLADKAVAAEDFAGAMAALAALRGPIDAFFEKVTVNDPDPAKRSYRLGLLARVRVAVHHVADFSKIVES